MTLQKPRIPSKKKIPHSIKEDSFAFNAMTMTRGQKIPIYQGKKIPNFIKKNPQLYQGKKILYTVKGGQLLRL